MSLADDLKVLLADAISFNHRVQGAHWNVVGPDFAQYHELFATIYEDVDGSIDPIAENVRKLGEFAPFRLIEFAKLRRLEDARETGVTAADLAEDLLAANDVLLETIRIAFAAAEEAGEQGIMDFLAGRDDMHKKWRWQLRASLGKP